MNFDDYQDACKQTAVFPADKGILYCAIGLSNESGEVLGKLKKWIRGDKELDKEAVAAELGDVMWYAAMLANELGTSLNQVCLNNITKLIDRKERGVLKGDGDAR